MVDMVSRLRQSVPEVIIVGYVRLDPEEEAAQCSPLETLMARYRDLHPGNRVYALWIHEPSLDVTSERCMRTTFTHPWRGRAGWHHILQTSSCNEDLSANASGDRLALASLLARRPHVCVSIVVCADEVCPTITSDVTQSDKDSGPHHPDLPCSACRQTTRRRDRMSGQRRDRAKHMRNHLR